MTKEIVFYMLFTIFSLAITIISFSYPINSSFLLRGLSIVMLALSIMILIKTFIKKTELNTQFTSVAFIIFLMLFLLIGLIYSFGFLFATLIFTFLVQMIFAINKNFYKILMVSVLISGFVFVVFFNLLGIAPIDSYIAIDHYFLFM